ncbi:uncharacterized protein LOC120277540 isoform X2 [Dioscorea cayenensis subsp. rotundata]|nr:uncharacterized protein LOC120277540 isoform X2 [Dioscorea cayenensis subsp. rotundata]
MLPFKLPTMPVKGTVKVREKINNGEKERLKMEGHRQGVLEESNDHVDGQIAGEEAHQTAGKEREKMGKAEAGEFSLQGLLGGINYLEVKEKGSSKKLLRLVSGRRGERNSV